MSNQVRLGLFALIGIAAVMISIVAVGNFSFNRTYDVYVLFDNASGLTKKAKVKIAGVDVGVLKAVALKDSKAFLTLAVNNDIVLYQNAKASIVSTGVIGTKYIEIIPGDSSYPEIEDGYTITSYETASLEKTLSNITGKIEDALNSITGNEKTQGIMDNLSDAIYDLKLVMKNISEQNAKITSAINNINAFSYNLAEITGQNKEDIRLAVISIRDVAAKIDILVDKVNNGDGTLAALINDKEMSQELKETVHTAKEAVASAKDAIDGLSETMGNANRLQLSWDYLGRYNVKDEKFRSDLGLTLTMRPERFYYIGISNVADTSDAKDQEEKDTMNTLTALLGFRKDKAEIYGGVMRSKAGVGIGYSFFDNIHEPYRKAQFNLNAYNFDRNGRAPEIDAGLRFGITRWLYAGVMVEDALYSASVTPYVKLEIKDTDIAALLGIISVAAVASK